MLVSEFIKLTGLQVTNECYHQFIEPEYIASDLDKDKWCKEWKRKGGMSKAYSWQVRHDAEQLSELRNVRANNDYLSETLSDAMRQLKDARENIKDMEEELKALREVARKFNMVKNIVQ